MAVVGEEKSQIALVRPKLEVVASTRDRGTTRSGDVTSGANGNMRSILDIMTSGSEDIA